MTELRLQLPDDRATAAQLRDVLAREGFRIVDIAAANVDAVAERAGGEVVEALPSDVAVLREQVEELERTVRELRNLDVAKSQFLANVSHELRTPLTAIVTYGEVLRDGLLGPVNARQKEAVQSVIGSSRQLLSMIEDILTYARTNARAIELAPTEFALSEVVRDVYRMNASLIRQKRLRYEACLNDDLPRLFADRDKVLHVLGNLIGNAIEFTSPRGLLRVDAQRYTRREGWVEVTVEDDGVGIAPEHHEMIFREFAQVDSSRARRHHGTGLGLAIARNVIQLHGGEIWVECEIGAGARFHFTLPGTDAAPAPPK
jgi:signal transduction histidine kinase